MVVLTAAAAWAADEKTVIVRAPEWDYRKFERVAVAPFGCSDPRGVAAAEALHDRIVAGLTACRAFTILSRADLKQVMQEQDLANLADAVDPATKITPGKIQAAQVLLVGKVTAYEAARERFEKTVPRLSLERAGRRGVVPALREERVAGYRHRVRLGASLRLLDTATGETVYSCTAGPIEKDDESTGGTPDEDIPELRAAAIGELSAALLGKIAPVRIEVELDSDMLIVATEYFDGKYEETRKISADRRTFLVAVTELPAECAGNAFRLAIALREGREALIEREFVWPADAGARGVPFEIESATLLGKTSERKPEFVAKLYAGVDAPPLLERKFRIERE
ncbi:MAG: hypothetical protein CHACPFDD_02816 [Phycisphaerae bacterium]|nr:hypothetical protein [Phycisphaerae bacterium]